MKSGKVFRVLGYSCAVEVLRAIENGNTHYNRIMFEVGINPCMLSKLLRRLIDIDLIKRETHGEYVITKRGSAVLKKVIEIESLFDGIKIV